MLKKVVKKILRISDYIFTNNGKGNQHIDIPCEAQKQVGPTHQAHQQTQIKKGIARPRIMKKILEIFKGDQGQFSSKRFVGIIGAFVLFGTMAHNSMSPQDIAPSKELVEAVEWVTILTLGFTSIDKFSKKDEN